MSHLVHALAIQPNVMLKVWAPSGEIPDNVEYLCTLEERKWLDNLMQQGGIAHLLRQRSWLSLTSPFKLLTLLYRLYQRALQQVEVIHVNWLQNAIPLGKGKKPLLITVLGSDFKLLKLPGMTPLLRRVLRHRSSIIAPNAEWMVDSLKQKFGDVAEIRPIVFGIAEDWYKLKRDWQTPKKKWIVVLRLTKLKIGDLFNWGEPLFNKTEHELHLFGPMQEQLKIPDWVIYHGSTHPKALQETWFPQATGLISLSQHDEGRPQVMLEAMAAGLPIIASTIPAHKNLLLHQQTGLLCQTKENFYESFKQLSKPEYNEKISLQARSWVKQTVGTWDDCAQRYIKAYYDLVERSS